MASAPASSVGSVVVDANVLIAICAREKDKFGKAETALKDFAARGSVFYAPGLIIGEALYVLQVFPDIVDASCICNNRDLVRLCELFNFR